jgi:hypothetical protein
MAETSQPNEQPFSEQADAKPTVSITINLSARRLVAYGAVGLLLLGSGLVKGADWLIDRESERFVARIEQANIAEREFNRLKELAQTDLSPGFMRQIFEEQDIDPATAELVSSILFNGGSEGHEETDVSADPETEFAQILTQEGVVDVMRNRLLDEGIDEEVVDQTLPALTGYAEEIAPTTTSTTG